MNIRDIVEAAEARGAAERAASAAERRTWEEQATQAWLFLAEHVMPKLRPATVEEYGRFLVGWLRRGGGITHVYDYPMVGHDWFTAVTPAELPPLYGAFSVNVIVPEGIRVAAPRRGHSAVVRMDGFTVDEPRWVPVYRDVADWLKALPPAASAVGGRQDPTGEIC